MRIKGMSAADVIRHHAEVDASGCWLWTGTRTPRGYGHVWFDGRMQAAHRLAYVTFVGPIPAGLVIDHICRVRECVNPAHLEPVTSRENTQRGAQALRNNRCKRDHELTPENTIEPGPGDHGRRCRQCKRDRDKARRRAA